MLGKLTSAVKALANDKDYWAPSNVQDKHKANFQRTLRTGALKPDETQTFILVAIDSWDSRILKEFVCPLMEKRKPIDWPKCGAFVDSMVDRIFLRAEQPKSEIQRQLLCGDFFQAFLKMLKTFKLVKRIKPRLCTLMEKSFQQASDESLPIHSIAYGLTMKFPWEDDMDFVQKAFGLLCKAVRMNPELYKSDLYFSLSVTASLIFQAYMANTKRAADIAKDASELLHFVKDEEWTTLDDVEAHTLAYEMLKALLEDYIYRHHEKIEIVKPNVGLIKDLWECGDDILERDANNIMTMISGNVDLMGDDVVKVIERYLSGEEPMGLTSFNDIFKKKPDLLYNRMDDLVEAMDGAAEWVLLTSMSLFWEMARAKPEIFTHKHIATFVKYMDHPNVVHLVIAFLTLIAEHSPEKVLPYDQKLIRTMKKLGDKGCAIPAILVSLERYQPEKGEKYLKVIWQSIEKVTVMMQVALLWNVCQIGENHLEILKEYREKVLELKKISATRDISQLCLNVMEGRSLESLSKNTKENQEGIKDLDSRASTNKKSVSKVKGDVKKVKGDVKGVKSDVAKQEAKLDNLEEVVEETTDKVQEIDRKTLSHAPSWSRDVAKLLNPVQKHDWRLLATRLNYTTDDVKNWATQPDPCLSLLDEWFATHKTREATYAILKALQEINRIDAAMIVENSLKNVEGIVDEDPPELTDPPPIFISYQWAHQSEVKLLNKHLEMAGFQSWMDIGQMGGGDKLFAKIDEGIRAAKVIICCVSEKYAQSPNCNREVNLSVTLGKPIIPLLMEKLSWPPPGTMGPIFSEYLFIRFFQREAEKTKDDRYWPVDKFQELLMQLRYSVVPDDSIISKTYKGWWNPPKEMISVKPKTTPSSTKQIVKPKTTVAKSAVSPPSPDVFISYQWGKQPQIKKLYSKLTSLGLTCWLDIMQMGGGDSLYDKIDKGVRGSKVLISCVTTKYSLSANCRREVSLADALKKPIVPLLLEKITWPPEGPMALVFTQLLYIDFTKPDAEIQNHWQCPQFDELLSKLGKYTTVSKPGVKQIVKPGVKSIDSSKKPKNPTVKAESKTTAKGLQQTTSKQSGRVLEKNVPSKINR